jgi:hypothetical protein
MEYQPITTHPEALEALSKLHLYEEKQESGSRELIQALNRQERSIYSQKICLQYSTILEAIFEATNIYIFPLLLPAPPYHLPPTLFGIQDSKNIKKR